MRPCVALRKESVDRNAPRKTRGGRGGWSLSARRAWIEMFLSMGLDGRFKLSLSARRAWIEILRAQTPMGERIVALRKESVDRNKQILEGFGNGK